MQSMLSRHPRDKRVKGWPHDWQPALKLESEIESEVLRSLFIGCTVMCRSRTETVISLVGPEDMQTVYASSIGLAHDSPES